MKAGRFTAARVSRGRFLVLFEVANVERAQLFHGVTLTGRERVGDQRDETTAARRALGPHRTRRPRTY